MIKVYSAPKSIIHPSFNGTREEYNKDVDRYINEVHEVIKEHSNHKLRGEIARFQVADGYAEYMVITPTKLVHLNIGDGYQFPYITSLKAKDITDNISRQRQMEKMFGW